MFCAIFTCFCALRSNFQLYARRSKFVPAKLRKKWETINLNYMSEEEDTDDGKILVKKLSWRSESKDLDLILACL